MTTQELKKIEERCESHYLEYPLPLPFLFALEDVKRLLSYTKAQDEEIERLKVLLAKAIGPENMINDIQYPD